MFDVEACVEMTDETPSKPSLGEEPRTTGEDGTCKTEFDGAGD